MRFNKGIKVEVLSKRDVPSGSWFPAEIVSGNGRYYNVEYDYYLPDGGRAIEQVQRLAIRPCPPPMEGLRSCVPGDIVEVFENNSWKTAKMIKVLDGGNYYVVALIGSSRGIKLHKSSIRLRLSWKNNTWVLAEKGSEKLTDGKIDISSVVKFSHKKVKQNTVVKNCKGDERCQISLRSLKKRPASSPSGVEMSAGAGAGRKMGAVNKGGKRQRLLVAHPSDIPEKGQSWRPAKLASVGPRCWQNFVVLLSYYVSRESRYTKVHDYGESVMWHSTFKVRVARNLN